jgi:hypothetical protein
MCQHCMICVHRNLDVFTALCILMQHPSMLQSRCSVIVSVIVHHLTGGAAALLVCR